MVLDPLSALSLASNVVQFIDFGCKLFSRSSELYKSATGRSVEDDELAFVAENLQKLVDYASYLPSDKVPDFANTSLGRLLNYSSRIPSSATSKELPENEKILRSVTSACKELAQNISSILESCKINATDTGSSRKWKALLVTLRRMRKSGLIDDMAKRLDTLSRQLTVCLVSILNDKQSAILSSVHLLLDSSNESQQHSRDELEILKDSNLEMLKQFKSLQNATLSMMEFVKENQNTFLWQRSTSRLSSLETISIKLLSLIETSERVAREQRFLDNLYFNTIEARHSKIMHAHTKTFKWIFERDESVLFEGSSSPNDFLYWLENQAGAFWISGKAGSGKSTLMKYLCSHQRTRTALRSWAGDQPLITASFFFWNAGTELQMSQEGLLRSLLYEVLRQYPGLIPIVFPSQWHDHCGNTSASTSWSWTYAELVEACGRLTRQKSKSAKFCFFVDGLDEYNGDCEDLVQLLSGLTDSSANFKICLSSRPWAVFKRSFGEQNCPKLLLEDLTREDIRLYVHNMLGESELYRNLLRREEKCQDFVNEIVDKANGVFLWVFLVVRSLIEGLKNEDRLSDLERRLRNLPADLEKYFQHMLDNIEDVYQVQAAQAFQVALQAKEPLTLMTFSFMDEEGQDYAIRQEIKPMNLQEIQSRLRVMNKRLNARCKDLLEVTTPVISKSTSNRFMGPLAYWKPEDVSNYRVDFLHRTVRDFLKTKKMQDMLFIKSGDNFNPPSYICQAFLAQIKCVLILPNNKQTQNNLDELIDDMAYYARRCEGEARESKLQIRLLDELERVLAYYLQVYSLALGVHVQEPLSMFTNHESWRPVKANAVNSSFLGFAVRQNLRYYVVERLRDQPSLITSSLTTLLLFFALFPMNRHSRYKQLLDLDMGRFLLDNGADPNNGVDSGTLWVIFVDSIERQWHAYSLSQKQNALQMVTLLFDHGAEIIQVQKIGMALVDFLLMRFDNWQTDSEEYESVMCKCILTMLARGYGPNQKYKGSTLWGHFVDNLPQRASRKTKIVILDTVEIFLKHGADPYFDNSTALWQYTPNKRPKRDELSSVARKLLQLYGRDQLAGIKFPLESSPRSKQQQQQQQQPKGEGGWLGWLSWGS